MIYRQKEAITGNFRGPDQSIAVLSGSHYPGTNGLIAKVFTISKSGKIATIKTGLESTLGSITWNEDGGGIGVASWADKGEVIYS